MKERPPILHSSTVAIVGLGLMGGSLALALKERRAVERIVGISRAHTTLDAALARGAIDHAATELDAARAANIIILATPARTILRQIPRLGASASDGALILDLGSTKKQIVRALDQLPARLLAVGGHPMCGKETSGFAAADAALYQDKTFVLSPTARSSDRAMATATELAQTLGARVVVLDAERHDQIVAAVSHLPYLVAANLVNTVAEWADEDNRVWELAASGFRDTTRLAASDVEMMLDILLTNGENIADSLRQYARHFAALAELVARGDEEPLRAILERALTQRRELFAARIKPRTR